MVSTSIVLYIIYRIRALQPGAKQATWREHARKGQQPRDHDERREEVSTRNHEKRTRTQDGKLGEQQDRGDRIDHEIARGIGRDEDLDPLRLEWSRVAQPPRKRRRPARRARRQGQTVSASGRATSS